MSKVQDFEDFLREEHGKEYTGLDDDMPDAYDAWLESLDLSDLIDLANKALNQRTT